jgi:hypothetical protein
MVGILDGDADVGVIEDGHELLGHDAGCVPRAVDLAAAAQELALEVLCPHEVVAGAGLFGRELEALLKGLADAVAVGLDVDFEEAAVLLRDLVGADDGGEPGMDLPGLGRADGEAALELLGGREVLGADDEGGEHAVEELLPVVGEGDGEADDGAGPEEAVPFDDGPSSGGGEGDGLHLATDGRLHGGDLFLHLEPPGGLEELAAGHGRPLGLLALGGQGDQEREPEEAHADAQGADEVVDADEGEEGIGIDGAGLVVQASGFAGDEVPALVAEDPLPSLVFSLGRHSRSFLASLHGDCLRARREVARRKW